jgi:hypothetical protein
VVTTKAAAHAILTLLTIKESSAGARQVQRAGYQKPANAGVRRDPDAGL